MGSVAHSRRIPRERGCLRHDLRPQVGSPSPSARVIAHCRRHVQDLILGGCWHLILMHASCREIPRGSHRPRFGIPTSQFISCILQSCSYSWPWVRCKSTRKNTRPLFSGGLYFNLRFVRSSCDGRDERNEYRGGDPPKSRYYFLLYRAGSK